MNKRHWFIYWITLISCNAYNNSDKVQGTYVGQFSSEFSKCLDTFYVNPFNEEKGGYHLVQRTGFFLIKNGEAQEKQYEVDSTIGHYNKETGQLQDQKNGRIFSFSSSGDRLIVGNSTYKKIK